MIDFNEKIKNKSEKSNLIENIKQNLNEKQKTLIDEDYSRKVEDVNFLFYQTIGNEIEIN